MKIKTNTLILSILLILIAITSISCKSSVNTSNTVENSENESNATETLATSNDNFQIKLDLENETLTVEAFYSKSDLLGTSFLLNRDFVIQKLICDGNEINSDEIKELITCDESYLVNLYKLPKFEKSLQITYTGFLSGNTGISPYVREKISKDFTFLRWETFYYPIFAENFQDTLEFLSLPLESKITVNIPNEYLALSPLELIDEIKNSDTTSFVYYGNISDLNCAIAKYKKLSLSSGEFYFLETTNIDELSNFVTTVMNKSHQYMNEHFGEVELPTDMKYIEIPEGFGSFAPKKAIYIDESAFKSVLDMGQLIHEFIHLGWNPISQDGEIQRARFFDEAFTSYFTARVLGNLLDEKTYIEEIERRKKTYKSRINSNKYELVPISEYGKYEYGDLSYIIGPIFFDELCKLVGTEKFDYATKTFLKKYRNTPVDFNIMCKEYVELCDNPELESFFNDWIFTTKACEQYIN